LHWALSEKRKLGIGFGWGFLIIKDHTHNRNLIREFQFYGQRIADKKFSISKHIVGS